jgi:Kef-type K+ transport system membrane component KefB
MQTPEQTGEQKLKQARSILLLNLLMMAFGLTAFLKALDSHVLWKIICSGAGVAIFVTLCTALFLRLRKLKKELKGNLS